MANPTPTVLVTGVAGNVGAHLLPQLAGYQVIGVDLRPPEGKHPMRFFQMDLGREDSCLEMMHLLREHRPLAVVHLAFVSDPGRAGMKTPEHMWQVNVAGTARMMEAITEANREEVVVKKFVFPSSSTVYGPDRPEPVTEEQPLDGHDLAYAVQKIEAEKVVKQRAPGLRACSSYILRMPNTAGAGVESFLLELFRGTPVGGGSAARLPFILPFGKRYLERRLQFVHVEDVARLMVNILHREPEAQRVTVLNVAGRGEPVTMARCLEISGAPVRRVPGKSAMRLMLNWRTKSAAGAITPEAIPYLTGECLLRTTRLKELLGTDYEKVVKYQVSDAFAESFLQASNSPQHSAAGQ